ncbi:MAG: hypothetical protein LBQ79_01620 [Deltaproteobacteria bacterium]|jgi:hypothetical protein|nr:hypothetical protein [Deltaproteobacteria bacterium]
MMWHRHLDLTPETEFCSPAIDDIIYHGVWIDWAELREAVLNDPEVRDDVEHICSWSVKDSEAPTQRYHFWLNYVRNLKTVP